MHRPAERVQIEHLESLSMAQKGDLFADWPVVCPFMGLEQERNWRSEKPDDRHRCFVEATPQPRTPAHQQAYCLSPNFTTCPIFLGWARVAAARPLPLSAVGPAQVPVAPPEATASAEAEKRRSWPPERGNRNRPGLARAAVAVAAVLGLGLAGVIFLPTLLANPGPIQTPTPPVANVPTASPTQLPSATPVVMPTPTSTIMPSAPPVATPTTVVATPTPTPTPFVYVVEGGDLLGRIAQRFGVTVADILAANPWITDPDRIQRGWEIIIPLPAGNLPSATPSPTAAT